MPDAKPKADHPTAAPAASPAPAVAFTPAPELLERIAHPETPYCAECGKALTPYTGSNPHKVGSLECGPCQRRYRPEDDA